jgi:hypothetical protein
MTQPAKLDVYQIFGSHAVVFQYPHSHQQTSPADFYLNPYVKLQTAILVSQIRKQIMAIQGLQLI